MRNQRGRYRAERNRTQRDGGAGMAMYRMEQRDKAKAERWKPYNWHKRLGEYVGRPIDRALSGKRGRRRKK